MLDVLITGGHVADGTGNPWYRSDVGIVGDGIAAIGNLTGAAAREAIDASGLVVAPGFIDTHVHCDLQLLHDPLHEAAIRQGVTTEVLAQDGRSCAPLGPRNREWAQRHDRWSPPADPLPWDWTSMAEFRARYDHTVAVNTVHLVGYETLCRAVLGTADRLAAPEELAAMQRLLRLEELVRKMTSLPTQRFGLTDRGLIRPGMAADIVVFGPDTIAHRATYRQPRQFPVGIASVLVNGQLAVRDGAPTGVLLGRPLP